MGPWLVPTGYLIREEPLGVVLASGSAPRRPTSVRRASWAGLVLLNVRDREVGMEEGMPRRRGARRKDIVVWGRWVRFS